jgi:hypothetical protein
VPVALPQKLADLMDNNFNQQGNEQMKKSLLLLAGASLFAFAALPASAEDEGPQHCSLETLHGTMVYASISSNQGVQWSLSGQEAYDGKGHMKYLEFLSYGGVPQTYTGTATYTMTANCIATVIYDTGVAPWLFFVSADGEHYYWNNNQNTGVISAGRADRVSKALLVP